MIGCRSAETIRVHRDRIDDCRQPTSPHQLPLAQAGLSIDVFGLLVRLAWPLALMPSADQVPVKNSHSTMLWHKWVVLISGSTGSALRAVRPSQPSHHAGCPTRSLQAASAAGSL